MTVERTFVHVLESYGGREASAQVAARTQDLLRSAKLDPADAESIKRELPGIHAALKQRFNVTSGDAAVSLEDVVRYGNANCIGSTQIFLAFGQAIGLDVQPVQVLNVVDGGPALHVATLVSLPDGESLFVDLLLDIAVSNSFAMRNTYRPSRYGLRTAHPRLFKRIRLLDRNGLMSFIESAAENHDAAISLDSQNAWAYIGKGQWEVRNARNGGPGAEKAAIERGISYISRALEIDPEMHDPHHWLGRYYYRIGQLQPARRHIETDIRNLESQTQSPHTQIKRGLMYTLLARIEQYGGREGQAQALFRRAEPLSDIAGYHREFMSSTESELRHAVENGWVR